MYCENPYPYSLNFESDWGKLVNQSSDWSRVTENWGKLSKTVNQSLVLDSEKAELVKATGRKGKRDEVSEAKTVAALKSHSDAERRRRERINAHYDSLRTLVPNNEKMDKATLLAEVINIVKQLKTTARQSGEGFLIPMDTNEVSVETLENSVSGGSFMLTASLCCDYWPDLLSDVRQAIGNLPVRILKSEISTLGGRVKIVFLITTNEGNIAGDVRVALGDILDRVSASSEYAQEIFVPRKRPRVSCLESSYTTV